MARISWKQRSLRLVPMCVLVALVTGMASAHATASEVRVERQGNRYVLLVDGKPFRVKGAGLSGGSVQALAARGANSFRTWNTGLDRDKVRAMLDQAEHNGLKVAMGIDVTSERHGFDYNDTVAVRRQQQRVLREVELYRDHPAVLMWVIGNELNLEYRDPKVWNAIGDIATAIHRVDPAHPVMTTIAGIDAALIADIQARAASLDLIGIQVYGDIEVLPEKLRESRWTGPYIVTEWGPTGHWESPLTSWGAAIEEDASRKALRFQERYTRYIETDQRQGLGSYVFLWGQKEERTPTWYGMFMQSGESTPGVDAMQYVWTGQWPANRAPAITPITLDGRDAVSSVVLAPGEWTQARTQASDVDADPLEYRWFVREESRATSIGGDAEVEPPSVDVERRGGGRDVLDFRAPEHAGAYRLFVEVHDGKGHAAYANFPFEVHAAEE